MAMLASTPPPRPVLAPTPREVLALTPPPHPGTVTIGACQGCGACLLTCPEHAIRPAEGTLIVLDHLCSGCGECIEICPVDAITEAAAAPAAQPTITISYDTKSRYLSTGLRAAGTTVPAGRTARWPA
jgi:Fe-S-cluster-containing hydrogenase component 2